MAFARCSKCRGGTPRGERAALCARRTSLGCGRWLRVSRRSASLLSFLTFVAQSTDRETIGIHRRNALTKIGAESGKFLPRDDDSGANRIARTIPYVVIAGHSRSKNGVAEPVIGTRDFARSRWLAYDPAISIAVAVAN